MKIRLTIHKMWRELVAICATALMLTSCQWIQGTGTLPLITERQECLLKHYTHLTGEVYPLTIAIDAPVDGSQELIDSVTAFLNETLYAFFDNHEDRHILYESVFSDFVQQLVSHYEEVYAPFFLVDSAEVHEFATDCLEVNLVAQTDAYVTYEVNHIFYGEGVETATEWVTFVKSDGHRLKKIISEYDMLRFFREHLSLSSDDVWANILNQVYDEDSLGEVVCSVGLLEDTVAHQYVYASGIFENYRYPLDSIAPYLSEEAQTLIGYHL